MARSSYIYVVNRLYEPDTVFGATHRALMGAWTVKSEMVGALAACFETYKFQFEALRVRDGHVRYRTTDTVDMTTEIEEAVAELRATWKKAHKS